jgi:ABC-type phosphate transport system substrate-binding protein
MWIWPDVTGLPVSTLETIRTRLLTNSKTHEAYLKLIRGEVDLILVSTLPSDDELREAQSLGLKLELCPIGLDGFVFLVNQANPVSNLSTADIVDIYSGKIDNWKKFTGPDAPITAFTRQPNSGSQELMEKLVMKGTPITATLKTERSAIFTMSLLLEGVDYDENAIGYSLYYYKNTMIDTRDVRPNVRLIAVDGIEPNPATISSRQYPYVFSIYAVTREDEPNTSKAYQLKEWLTSNEGQDLIGKAGYVGLGG